jgi:hypothetical protein
MSAVQFAVVLLLPVIPSEGETHASKRKENRTPKA